MQTEHATTACVLLKSASAVDSTVSRDRLGWWGVGDGAGLILGFKRFKRVLPSKFNTR